MRRLLVTILTLSLAAVFAPASALQANDTMTSWKQSSAAARSKLLELLLGKPSGDAETASILKCLNETSNIPAHTDLQIADVVKACRSSEDAGQPV